MSSVVPASYVSGLRCVSCLTEYAPDSGLFVCSSCGGNLEVHFDHTALVRVLTRERLAKDRERSILRYLPLLPVTDRSFYPPLVVGGTELVAPGRLREQLELPHLYLKDDTRNPSASFKDRASAVALAHARSVGAAHICAASTGNAGSSMACLSASVGQPCVVFVPRTAPRAKVAQLQIFGARVLAVDGSYDDAFDLSLELSRAHGWYNRNTGTNPYTREGKKTCALEICEQLGWQPPDRILVPVGDGNIISGIFKGLRDLKAIGLIDRLPKVMAIQSCKSDAVVRAVRALGGRKPEHPQDIRIEAVQATTMADSISVDLPRDGVAAVRAVVESGGGAVAVSDEEILAAQAELAKTTGIFAEPAGATAYAGLKALLTAGALERDERVVVMVTGNGLKDVTAALRSVGEPPIIEPRLAAVEELLGL